MLGKGRRKDGDNVGGRKPDNRKDASIHRRDFVCAAFCLTAACTSPLEGNEEMPTMRLCTRRQLTQRRLIILFVTEGYIS
ncbi:unnamed protein product [Sphagnum jensenii]|uniref:Uncharacterized protein n=1 Tax=Sphagnum jensenii TaxID=128206 RepID=A0ABP0WW56_9BRYO